MQNISASNSQNQYVESMADDDDTVIAEDDNIESPISPSVDGAAFVVATTTSKMTTSGEIGQQQVNDVYVSEDEKRKTVSSQGILEVSGGGVVVKEGGQQQQGKKNNESTIAEVGVPTNIRDRGDMMLDETAATTKNGEVVRDEETLTEPEPKHICAAENETSEHEDRCAILCDNNDGPSSGLEGKHHSLSPWRPLINGGKEEIIGGHSKRMMDRQSGRRSTRSVAARRGGSKNDVTQLSSSSSSVCRDVVSNNVDGVDDSPPPSPSTRIRVCFTGVMEAIKFCWFLAICRLKQELFIH